MFHTIYDVFVLGQSSRSHGNVQSFCTVVRKALDIIQFWPVCWAGNGNLTDGNCVV